MVAFFIHPIGEVIVLRGCIREEKDGGRIEGRENRGRTPPLDVRDRITFAFPLNLESLNPVR
jgi:hypothetical protein